MLQGMTNKDADELVPLANSWLHAPEMKILSETFRGGTYDQAERAYLVEKSDPGNLAPLKIELEASTDSPLLNPAIIIKNWGSQPATLSINGKSVPQGEDFRQGIRKGPLGEDLILWIRLDKQKPVTIVLEWTNNRE